MERINYKSFDNRDLEIDMYYPNNRKVAPKSMIILFFGGSWRGGTMLQLYKFGEELAQYGAVVALPRYRTYSSDETLVDVAIKDAIYATEHLFLLAQDLGISSNKIVLGGASAGGHLALSSLMLESFVPEDFLYPENVKKLLLFNPVTDTVEFADRSEALNLTPYSEEELSPVHHVKSGGYEALVFHGVEDTTVPIETSRYFRNKMKEYGNECTLIEYEGMNHGFFNYRATSIPEFYSVLGHVIQDLYKAEFIELEFKWK